MTQDYVLFSGCSLTAGNGWSEPAKETPSFYPSSLDSEYLWVNICHREIAELRNLSLLNIAQDRVSNHMIFVSTLEQISKLGSQIKKVFCQWTAAHQYQWTIGYDESSTVEVWEPTPELPDVRLSTGEFYPREYIEDIKLRFRSMHHVHWEILDIVRYSTIISRTCQALGINCYHINGNCPWDRDFFVYVDDPREVIEKSTPFTKNQLLNIGTRSEHDTQRRYANAHYDYRMAGGIKPHHWINLYDSFKSLQTDNNLDQQHPGINSNQLYSQTIKQHLEQTL